MVTFGFCLNMCRPFIIIFFSFLFYNVIWYAFRAVSSQNFFFIQTVVTTIEKCLMFANLPTQILNIFFLLGRWLILYQLSHSMMPIFTGEQF